ncbi:MAG: methylated-DNA--[protein]-cysteine S-methyltransferase [Candidatus Bathyarchaeota archaeon]|nr:methylated-DNA--[protein]-cysteine S-methyltransferase [Candidatus Bathyarchaeota archaeon]
METEWFWQNAKMGVETAGKQKSMLEVYVKNLGTAWFGVACREQRVAAASFGYDEKTTQESLNKKLPPNTPRHVVAAPSTFAQNVLALMKNIYEGKGTPQEVPLDMERLSVYTQLVLRTVTLIPVGYVASYGGVAAATGGGARAVGNVMASNPFVPLVPCHRVVTSSLGIGGYGGGLHVKIEFLKREKRGFTEPKEVPVKNRGLRVFPVEFVLRKLEKNTIHKNYQVT